MDTVRTKTNNTKLQKSDCTLPPEILDDLSSRFIINIPEAEKKDLIRVLFQIELAHWFYIDFYCKRSNILFKPCGMREFAQYIFKHIPFLTPYVNDLDRIIDEWKDYKFSVPTYGAILLDEDLSHVLLVQSYWSRSSWGFPKGKINKSESACHCAIREVFEETGFNITPHIDPNEYIEANIHEQMVRLYIIPGVSKDTEFEPRTRNEIRAVSWFPLSDLPISRKDVSLKFKTGLSNNAFFMVSPFLRKLRHWIALHSQDPLRRLRRNRYKSCGDIESVFELSNDFIKMKDGNKRRTPESISQVREDCIGITDCRLSSHGTDECSMKVERHDQTLLNKDATTANKKDLIIFEPEESSCKTDSNEMTNATAENTNMGEFCEKKMEKTIRTNVENKCTALNNITTEPSVKQRDKFQTSAENGNSDNIICNGGIENTQLEIKDNMIVLTNNHKGILKLSDKIRTLEIKAWSAFKFDLKAIFE